MFEQSTLDSIFEDEQGTLISRLSVEQYHAMLNCGILEEGAPIELLDGQLFYKERRDLDGEPGWVSPRHAMSVCVLMDLLCLPLLPLGVFVRSQQPLTLGNFSEPEPDLSVVRGRPNDYEDRHPLAEEVLLVIEVAGRSLKLDQGLKQGIYAGANIPQYWIVNQYENVVELLTDPDPVRREYRQRSIAGFTDNVSLVIDERAITLPIKRFLHPRK